MTKVLNSMGVLRHRFLVLKFCEMHNRLVDRGDLTHLSPHTGPSTAPRSGHYPCYKRPAAAPPQSVAKRPASGGQAVRKRPASGGQAARKRPASGGL